MNKFVFLKGNSPLRDGNVQENDVGQTIMIEKGGYKVCFIRSNETLLVPISNVQTINIAETGDEFSHKICDRCFKYLDTDTSFSNNRHKKDNKITKRPSCKSCRKKKDGKKIPSEQILEWGKRKPSKNEIFECPICNKKSIVGISKHVLDHNHQTGDVRGYICESCNTGIGRFDDDIEILKNAIKWLEEH